MKLNDVRKQGIEYCEANNCKCTYISHDSVQEFYLSDKEDHHTVFFMNRNGSLAPCRNTEYAVAFHKELKRRKRDRIKNDKRKIADLANRDSLNQDLGNE